MEEISTLSAVEWSRALFALTAMYHWIFVPLTLGLGFICAVMETIYYKTGNPEWKSITKFWMKIFAINFAVGVATGLILEFQFGTNWSNYSYFVGDIFGAPLAIEGMFAFFIEATFMAVMYFGWEKVSKGFHLTATWMTSIGANLSAVWILIANSWMQFPTGMKFNIETARNEMVDFSAVAFSETSITKLTHTVSSGFLLAAVVVVAISAWFLLKNVNISLAKKSIRIASIWGIISALLVAWTGDQSGYVMAKTQPMKFAAAEALYEGGTDLSLTAFAILNHDKEVGDGKENFHIEIGVPYLLSHLTTRGENHFIPGIDDLILGNKEHGIISTQEKMVKGEYAINKLNEYNIAKKAGDTAKVLEIADLFDKDTPEGKKFNEEYFRYFGYGFFDSPLQAMPNIALTFYSFRVMVMVGGFLVMFFAIVLFLSLKDQLTRYRWMLWVMLFTLPLPYIAGQAGWIVAEVGRQPWTVQDMLPTMASISDISATTVKTTFFIFAILFTIMLIAEIKIMIKQIRLAEKED